MNVRVSPADIRARDEVIRALAHAHDRFSEREQVLLAEGKPVEAAGAHEYALWCLRAYRAETDDPKPKGRK